MSMASVVQMLESEQEFSEVIEQIFQYTGAYLKLEGAQLLQIAEENDSASVICEWMEEGLQNQRKKHQIRPVKEYPFMNGKPYMLSSSTPLNQEFRVFFQQEGLRYWNVSSNRGKRKFGNVFVFNGI